MFRSANGSGALTKFLVGQLSRQGPPGQGARWRHDRGPRAERERGVVEQRLPRVELRRARASAVNVVLGAVLGYLRVFAFARHAISFDPGRQRLGGLALLGAAVQTFEAKERRHVKKRPLDRGDVRPARPTHVKRRAKHGRIGPRGKNAVQLETVDVAKFPQAAYARPAATSPDARPIKTSSAKRAGHPTMAGQDGSENPCARPKTPPERKPPVRKTQTGQGLVQTQEPVDIWIKKIQRLIHKP